MAMSVKVQSHLPETLEAFKAAKARALEKIGITGENYASDYAPWDTGRLAASIAHQTEEDCVHIGTNVEYAIYQEFGTSRQTGTPFLRPMLQNHINEYKDIVQQEMQSG